MKIYLDATDAPLGRIGSFAIKRALIGDEIIILNSEKAVVSGNKKDVIETISNWKNKGGKSLKGPKVPRSSERLLKRMIRGMLPWDRQRGRDAYKRIKCYKSGDYDTKDITLTKLNLKQPLKSIRLEEVSRLI
jgi:large subunit ribosomal protein L13